MLIKLESTNKCISFISIFKNLYKISSTLLLEFKKDELYVQGIDNTKSALYELKIACEWFDFYEYKNVGSLGINSVIFSKILSIHKDNQIIILDYDDTSEEILLSFDSDIEFKKQFNIPLIDVDSCNLEIDSDMEYDAEFIMLSKTLDNIINELKIFDSDVIIMCNENQISFNSNGSEGSMKYILYDLTSEKDFVEEYSCLEEIDIKLLYSIKLLTIFTSFEKITKDVKLEFSEDKPMKLLYKLDDTSYLSFYLSNKLMEDAEY